MIPEIEVQQYEYSACSKCKPDCSLGDIVQDYSSETSYILPKYDSEETYHDKLDNDQFIKAYESGDLEILAHSPDYGKHAPVEEHGVLGYKNLSEAVAAAVEEVEDIIANNYDIVSEELKTTPAYSTMNAFVGYNANPSENLNDVVQTLAQTNLSRLSSTYNGDNTVKEIKALAEHNLDLSQSQIASRVSEALGQETGYETAQEHRQELEEAVMHAKHDAKLAEFTGDMTSLNEKKSFIALYAQPELEKEPQEIADITTDVAVVTGDSNLVAEVAGRQAGISDSGGPDGADSLMRKLERRSNTSIGHNLYLFGTTMGPEYKKDEDLLELVSSSE